MAPKKKGQKKKSASEQLELERWKEQGKALKAAELHLRKAEFTHQWAIADWMLAGEKDFGKTKAYDEAEKVTGFTRESLQSFASVARKVLTRVKGLSFGHHRLVMKLPQDEQEKELCFALEKGLSVERFDLHLKGNKGHDERHKIGPTNTDIAAKKFIERCDKVMGTHWSLRSLQSGQPPAAKQRDGLVKKIKETAAKLNEIADHLETHWQLYLPLPPAVGFPTKKQYEEWKSHEGWRKREAAKVAAAGSGQ